ncbi:MAG: type II toxin-antitoxin system VapC family toxin [Solirubrobacterales bacterium]|nr:type II toxin-antitoxin system VapC family toxin [Solirubrobacterales bacterium]
MNPPVYADTSALAKLFLREAEGPALEVYLDSNELTLVSSQLSEVELVRAVSRVDVGKVSRARDLLASIVLLPITSSVRKAAGDLFPGRVRSLDAIHLATALEIKADLNGLLTYDDQMAKLAEEAALKVVTPR